MHPLNDAGDVPLQAGIGAFLEIEDAQDAGREFIRASLDGNYQKALFYLYRDPGDNNVMLLDKQKKNYDQLPAEQKVNYKEANIRANPAARTSEILKRVFGK